MRIGLLKNWANADFSIDYYDQALDALSSTECFIMINDEDSDDDKLDPEANQAINIADSESDASDSYFKDSSEISRNTKLYMNGETIKNLKKEKLKMKYFYFEKNWLKKFSRLVIPLELLCFGKKILACFQIYSN